MSSSENVLTPTRAFVCLTLFDLIRMPLALLPLLIVYIIEVKPGEVGGCELFLLSGSGTSYQLLISW